MKKKITTVAQAKKEIKGQHNVDVVDSILKGQKHFLVDIEQEGENQSNGTHFATDKQLIETANDICD